jgi:hypothetical protein
MIEKLTSELNRINQGCGERVWCDYLKTHKNCGFRIGFPDDYLLCPKCRGRKETLKKVSLMWADKMLDLFDAWDCLNEAEEMKVIKSLMEKA